MILRLSQILLCGGALTVLGCQNTLERPARFADRESFETRFSLASDDPSGLETGRGHSPSLASELADRRLQAKDSKRSLVAVERLLERGHDADSRGRAQEARTYYEEVLSQQPDHPEAHHRLAILADRAGDFASAEIHYQQALKANPGNADVLNDLGYSCFLQGRAADSERYLSQAQKINSRHPHVQENLSLLYDPQKAEKVLLTVMGPHQTRATLAKLFEDFPAGVQKQPTAQTPPDRPSINVTEITPAVPGDLQQQMAEARLQNIAEPHRASGSAGQPGGSNPSGGLPQLPGPYPQADPPRTGFGTSGEIAAGRINEGFRSLDNAGPTPSDPGLRNNQFVQGNWQNDAGGNVHSAATQDQRAAAPQWTAPPVAWPDDPSEITPRGAIEQASYSEPAAYSRNAGPRQSPPSATQRAAEIGMATGPGALFQPIEDAFESAAPQQSGILPTQSFPGIPPRPIGGLNPQPSASDGQVQPRDAFTAQFGSAPQTQPRTTNTYDQTRAVQSIEHYQDQPKSSPGTLEAGRPEPWPASSREPYDARQQDLPIIVPQQPISRPPTLSGQSLPYNPAPQNYGGNW